MAPAPRSRAISMRRAAGTIFALSAILPLLLFLFYLWRFELLDRSEVTAGLALALLVAVLGFVVFRRLVDRVADLARTLETPETAVQSLAAGGTQTAVPGLGQVAEIGEIAQSFSRLLEDLRASTERLEDLVFKLGTLSEMVELAARIPKIQDLLERVLERTMGVVRASIGSIMLLDRDGETLRVVCARGLPREVLETVALRVGEGIAGKVAELGEPVLVDDIETDARFGRENDPRYGTGSFLCSPIRASDRIIGVINLSRKESLGGRGPSVFSKTDLQFLSALMTYTAYAVDNARLLEEARVAAERLQQVVENQQLRLTLAQQKMVEAAKLSALGHLVAGVAHELNNPITILLSTAELLLEEAPPEARPRLMRLEEAAKMAGSIVHGLLTFARRRPLERSQVDIGETIDRVLDITAPSLELARIDVERQLDPDLPPVWADGNQLQQVLLNLVTNAKQAMADGSSARRLRVSAHRRGPERIVIEVADTGPGMPPELLPSIFDPFVTSKGPHGTGLGLSISYGIVQEHGGTISATSVPGRGSTFTVELPVGTPVAAPEPAARLPVDLRGRFIMTVEDNAAVQEILRLYLERAGCRTLTLANAEQALARLGDLPDVVIADVLLPGMNALGLYREATARHPELRNRFLFASGALVPEPLAAQLTATGATLLQKPFGREQLLAAVRDVLGRASG